MMETILFALPGNELLADRIITGTGMTRGMLTVRKFPDKESYVRIMTDVKDKDIVLLCTLYRPDDQLLALYFLSKTLKRLGAKRIRLIAPYLAYMRQDREFNEGEAITSEYFASLISSFVDGLITVDPHLHRIRSLSEIYTIPCFVLHAASLISKYIGEQIEKPLLIGPDGESKQWVSAIAKMGGVPFIILRKERHGDTDVEVTVPQMENFKDFTPVLMDDIISTGKTMVETIRHLVERGYKSPICIATHAIFAGQAHQELMKAGAGGVVTCNTVTHFSNKIDVSSLLVNFLKTDLSG